MEGPPENRRQAGAVDVAVPFARNHDAQHPSSLACVRPSMERGACAAWARRKGWSKRT